MALKLITAGESHGPGLTCIVEGLPAGLALDRDAINGDMARRQLGHGRGGRMKIERDAADVTEVHLPRPGHADLVGLWKYGFSDVRNVLERASARETAARVAGGALCKAFLSAVGVEVRSHVVQIGSVKAAPQEAALT